MDYGFIVIYILDFNTEMPIKSEEITVYEHKSSNIVFYKMIDKNFSGKTDRIKVKAPSKLLSQYPIQNAILPYSLYDIKVKAKGYVDALILGVQVFPYEIAIQKILMIKLPIGSKQGEITNVIVIPPNTLVQ